MKEDYIYKAFKLFVDWVTDCDFGYDNIPDIYEKYKDKLVDYDYTEGLMMVAIWEVLGEDRGNFIPISFVNKYAEKFLIEAESFPKDKWRLGLYDGVMLMRNAWLNKETKVEEPKDWTTQDEWHELEENVKKWGEEE